MRLAAADITPKPAIRCIAVPPFLSSIGTRVVPCRSTHGVPFDRYSRRNIECYGGVPGPLFVPFGDGRGTLREAPRLDNPAVHAARPFARRAGCERQSTPFTSSKLIFLPVPWPSRPPRS